MVGKRPVAFRPVSLRDIIESTLDIGNWFSTNNMGANTARPPRVSLS